MLHPAAVETRGRGPTPPDRQPEISARPRPPAVSKTLLRDDVHQGLTPARLHQDRILNEAAETADPLRLMRLFGIKERGGSGRRRRGGFGR
ncbi:hypothetical protein GCM10010425_65840 [Streptomyces spororaveus]